ncbi:MAG: hypothetical protein H6509_14400 [Bryobacterales bacterium]|nr:hypothetical protein [Acidobacteriota bacterium]MCB9385802.1 hypothetical protein [Bryobacterales bacterium]
MDDISWWILAVQLLALLVTVIKAQSAIESAESARRTQRRIERIQLVPLRTKALNRLARVMSRAAITGKAPNLYSVGRTWINGRHLFTRDLDGLVDQLDRLCIDWYLKEDHYKELQHEEFDRDEARFLRSKSLDLAEEALNLWRNEIKPRLEKQTMVFEAGDEN